jgi:hypothetical protein
MKAGDIVFVRGNSLLSKLIRRYDGGQFSHAAIAVSETHVLEAQGFTRSRIVPFYFKDYEIIDLQLTNEERMLVIRLVPFLVGRWYDYFQILGYLLKGNFNNPNHLICSEIIAIILYQIGKIEDYSEVKNVTPNQLHTLLKERFR